MRDDGNVDHQSPLNHGNSGADDDDDGHGGGGGRGRLGNLEMNPAGGGREGDRTQMPGAQFNRKFLA